MPDRPLGKTQRGVLRAMREHRGRWSAGCGWHWDTASGTDRIMQSLERRGLVRRIGTTSGYGSYELTKEGRKA